MPCATYACVCRLESWSLTTALGTCFLLCLPILSQVPVCQRSCDLALSYLGLFSGKEAVFEDIGISHGQGVQAKQRCRVSRHRWAWAAGQ